MSLPLSVRATAAMSCVSASTASCVLKAGRKSPSAIFITRASGSVVLTRGSESGLAGRLEAGGGRRAAGGGSSPPRPRRFDGLAFLSLVGDLRPSLSIVAKAPIRCLARCVRSALDGRLLASCAGARVLGEFSLEGTHLGLGLGARFGQLLAPTKARRLGMCAHA